MILIPILYVALLKICYKDFLISCIVSVEIALTVSTLMSEGIGILLGNYLYQDNMLVMIDGNSLMRWEIYVITLTVRIITLYIAYRICRNFCCQIIGKDFLMMIIVFLMVWLTQMFGVIGHLNMNKIFDTIIYLFQAIFPGVFLLLFLYIKNTTYLQELERRDKMQIAQLQQQYAYYQDKFKDEERIRSIYHDMKNHLLVLEGSQGTDETQKMAQELRSQIADYENYIHTGNKFLDIIIRDKSEKAREKQIDFSAFIDFSGIDFIEPLDISTLFGNGIDNAIEASEKLPKEQRVILIKAGTVQDFVSILIENNCSDEVITENRTTKSDDFLHGFGIPNMQKAAEKYGGTYTIQQENRKFTLKILLPIAKIK